MWGFQPLSLFDFLEELVALHISKLNVIYFLGFLSFKK